MRHLALLLCLVATSPALAQVLDPVPAAARTRAAPRLAPVGPGLVLEPGSGGTIVLEAGAGRVLRLPGPAGSVFAADPRVAEVRPASPVSLFIFGVAPGRTTVAAMDAAGAPVATYDVTVRPSSFGAGEAQGALRRLLPGRDLRVETRPNGLVVLGEVQTPAEAHLAVTTLRSYMGQDHVVENRLSVLTTTQVNLRVRVAEVGREVTRQFGINWQAVGQVGRFALGAVSGLSLADPTNLPAQILGGYRGAIGADAIIEALAQDRLVNILAEPNLTAISGETASFLVGGEFPIPIGQQNGQITIDFKQYGISLAFVPTVLASGRIVLRVRPEVSELTDTGAVRLVAGNNSLSIPALTVRRAETTVELGSGQSFAIAGLLQDSNRSIGRALPGIGELPILGALFRSDRYQRNETELVIVVTPYLVRPAASPDALRTPVDRLLPPSDADRSLRQRQFGDPDRPIVNPVAPNPAQASPMLSNPPAIGGRARPPGAAGFVVF